MRPSASWAIVVLPKSVSNATSAWSKRVRRRSGTCRPIGHSAFVFLCTPSNFSFSGWIARQTSRRVICVAGRESEAPPGPRWTEINPARDSCPAMRRTTTGFVPMLQASRALVEIANEIVGDEEQVWRATEKRVAIVVQECMACDIWQVPAIMNRGQGIRGAVLCPELPENPVVPSCQTVQSGFYRFDDTARLPGHSSTARPNRAGSGRVGQHRLARRANALVLLDDGMSCAAVAKVLLLDSSTIRSWHQLYAEEGIEGLASFGYEGSACRLSEVPAGPAESLDHRNAAADDTRGWRLDRDGIQHFPGRRSHRHGSLRLDPADPGTLCSLA